MSAESRFPSMSCTSPVEVPCPPGPTLRDFAQVPTDAHNPYPPPSPAVALTHAPAGQAAPTTPAATLPEWAKYLIGGGVGLVVGFGVAKLLESE